MTIWITILHLGVVVGVLPYAQVHRLPAAELLGGCQQFIQDRSQIANLIEATGYPVDGVTLDCAESAQRPKLGEKR